MDANWGPQDAAPPSPNSKPTFLYLFKSRSISGCILWMNDPIHWISKCQSITARSSAEAEIYATDKCIKILLHITNISDDIGLRNLFIKETIDLYNDNQAYVKWAQKMTTKGLRHIQMQENAIRECVQQGLVTIKHVNGKINLADISTKEDKDVAHFLILQDHLM
eukprot:5309494-Ditylum_brightwellii.AAC.1